VTGVLIVAALAAAPARGRAQAAPSAPAGGSAGQSQPLPPGAAGRPAPAQAPAPSAPAGAKAPSGVAPPSDYVIGPDDVLAVFFWREKDLSADNVVVRPDGKITLPIINDIQAAGLTPDQLREKVSEAAGRYVEDANATVVVKTINSRRVFVTGQVSKPGPYPLLTPTTVLQMLSIAGGMGDFAKKSRIVVMRTENGVTTSFKFNYKEVVEGRNLQQNIMLKPGDTIIVP
jgi:polysaccharide export outer membrane protein